MPQVSVLVREHCPACESAVADARAICAELDVACEARDVDTDRELRAEYGDRVPVVLIDGVEHGFWKVEPERFRAALHAAGV